MQEEEAVAPSDMRVSFVLSELAHKSLAKAVTGKPDFELQNRKIILLK
jgi:hypothetical protein